MAQKSPNGRPRVGFTLIELIVVMAIVGIAAALLLVAVQQVRGAAARADCQNRVRQIALAAHQYHDVHRQLPAGYRTDERAQAFMGWLTRLLPYLEQQPLHDRALRDYARQPLFWLPFEGHANLATPVPTFNCPAGDRSTGSAHFLFLHPDPFPVALSWYLGVSGTNSLAQDGLLFTNSGVRFGEVTDGLANTLLFGERPPSPDNRMGWWYAGAGMMSIGGGGGSFLGVRELRDGGILPMCDPNPSRFRPGRLSELCDVVHFWSLHPGGANFAFADGSVHFLRYSAADILPALATRAGGEVAVIPD